DVHTIFRGGDGANGASFAHVLGVPANDLVEGGGQTQRDANATPFGILHVLPVIVLAIPVDGLFQGVFLKRLRGIASQHAVNDMANDTTRSFLDGDGDITLAGDCKRDFIAVGCDFLDYRFAGELVNRFTIYRLV